MKKFVTNRCTKPHFSLLIFLQITAILVFFEHSGQSQIISSTKDVFPVNDKTNQVSLNGMWKFKYINSSSIGVYASFSDVNYDDSPWPEIPVPGNWEIYGFKGLLYGYMDNVTGLYRTKFTIPLQWQGQHIFIRFEGVEFGYQLWINGSLAGKWESSYNPCQFDITPFINFASENVLAVRVYTQPKGYKFDTNDDWALTGIDRDVNIFPVPDMHLDDMTVTTSVMDSSNATIHLSYKISSFSNDSLTGATIKGNLYSPGGSLFDSYSVSLAGTGDEVDTIIDIEVADPQLWNAETPNLYVLESYLTNNSDTLQHTIQKIGIRQLTIDGLVVKINGVPVKFRGVNRHEIHPLTGRATTHQQRLQDLELMKKANINMVRTSHYPLQPEFIALCDSIGMYVMDEVPFGFGDEWLTDTSYTDILLTRAEATVMRDKNHPSVIIWSIGNENPYTDITAEVGLHVKQMDTSRAICYPQYGGSVDNMPAYVDIFSTHYPDVNSLKQYLKSSKRPYLTTEYDHSLGLAFEGHKTFWNILENSNAAAGGCVWEWVDQGIKRYGKIPGIEAKTTENWISDTSYYDMVGDQGADGIMYSDRNPQPDYWEVRKNYAQVRVSEDVIRVSAGSQNVNLTLQNHFDFVNLKYHVSCSWYLCEDRDTIQSGNFIPDCLPHDQTTTALTLNIPNDPSKKMYLLYVDITDKNNRHIYEHTIKLLPKNTSLDFAERFSDTLNADVPKVENKEDTAVVRIGSNEFGFNKSTGKIYLTDDSLQTKGLIINGPFVRVGRKLTMAEERMVKNKVISKYLLDNPTITTADNSGNPLKMEAEYTYSSDVTDIAGTIGYDASDQGRINIDFKLVPQSKTSKYFLDAGLSFLLDPSLTEFRCLGYGPFPSYPGKSELNEYGIYHLTADDINIQGNHAGVNIAVLTDTMGNGMAVVCDSCNLDIDKTTSGIILSYNSLVSGKGTKFTETAYRVLADSKSVIEGHFTIIPIKGNNWPQVLHELFGDSQEKVTPFRPFLAGYDYYTAKFTDIVNVPSVCLTTATASTYESPNKPYNVLDSDLNTQWLAKGDGTWLQIRLCASEMINSIGVAFQNGDTRSTIFDIQVSNDGLNWTTVLDHVSSSGTSLQPEIFSFDPVSAQYIRIIGHGNSIDDETGITEISLGALSSISSAKESAGLLEVYPNPFNNSLIINIHAPEKANYDLVLYDLAGKPIRTLLNNKPINDSFQLELNDNDLMAGIYFLILKSKHIQVEQRIVKN